MMKKKTVTGILLALSLFCTACSSAVADENSGIPTEEQIAAVKNELGDDLQELKFSVDGKIYQYPVRMQEMQDNGWYIDQEAAKDLKTLPGNVITTAFSLRKNKDGDYPITSCSVQAENVSSSEIEISQSTLGHITFHLEKGATVILPQGITWDSTFDDVCAAYHPADDCIIDSDGMQMIQFSNADYSGRMTIEFNSDTHKIKSIEFWR